MSTPETHFTITARGGQEFTGPVHGSGGIIRGEDEGLRRLRFAIRQADRGVDSGMAGGRDSVLLVYVNGTEAAPVRVDMLGALVTVGPPTRDELLRWVGPESRAKAVDDAIERGSSK